MAKWMDFSLILLTVGVIVFVLYWILKQEAEENNAKKKFTYSELQENFLQFINDYTNVDVTGMGLSNQVVKRQEKQRRSVAKAVRSCNTGNAGARAVVLDMSLNYLESTGITEDNIDYTIPFNQMDLLTPRQMLEIMMYMNDCDGDEGFLRLHEKYNFARSVIDTLGTNRYEVSAQDIREMYVEESYELVFSDKLKILSRLLYADTIGLGVVDTLNTQRGCIEEIQMGLSGFPPGVYDYKKILNQSEDTKTVLYSKDSIYILIHGINVWLSFLGFPTDNEMERVLRILSQSSGVGELTSVNPWTSVEAADGRRITIARPPMVDSWNGLIRKFDTLMVTDLDTLYHDKPGAHVVNEIIKYLARSGSSVGVTGEMAAGKTSLLRTILKDTRPDLSIRIIESGSFELGVRQCLPTRNAMPCRVSETLSEAQALAWVRRTTGQIMCIGEINSLAMANLTMNVAKFSSQTFFSAHYITTDDMVQDFVTAKICEGNFSSERLAEMDAVKTLGFDIHLRLDRGIRYVQYINEVEPMFDLDGIYDNEPAEIQTANVKLVDAVRDVRKQLGNVRTYRIRRIISFDEKAGKYVFHEKPSENCYEKAFSYMPPEQYTAFCRLFDLLEANGVPTTVKQPEGGVEVASTANK